MPKPKKLNIKIQNISWFYNHSIGDSLKKRFFKINKKQ